MGRSQLFDRGRATIYIYPEIVEFNNRGIPLARPADTPVAVRATIVEDRSSNAELPGQVSARVVRCTTRSAPVGPWARVFYDGEDWDVAFPPHVSEGMSKATAHVEFTLRSRNGVQPAIRDEP